MKEIENLLPKMIELLSKYEVIEWANALDKCRVELSAKPEETSHRILSMYGGMGSLNDVVLYDNGQPLSKENSDFDNLRTELYRICKGFKN